VGRPYPRGSFLALSWPLKAAVVLSCVAVGWALPVLGVSLLAFLLIDALIGWWSRRSAVRSAKPTESPEPDPAHR
jgi:hypothetical protein